MTDLFLVRHGESTWNVEGRLQGQTMDVPLTDRGCEQAADVAARLRDVVDGLPRLISSDQRRASTTAKIIGEVFGIDVDVDVRLREQSLGALEGKLSSELRPEPTPPGQHISEIAWGGGESLQQVHARCAEFLADLPGGGPVIAVSHGDTLRVMLAVLAGRSHRDVEWVPIGNTDVIHRSF